MSESCGECGAQAVRLVWATWALLLVLGGTHGFFLWYDRGRRAFGVLLLSMVLELAAAGAVGAFLRSP